MEQQSIVSFSDFLSSAPGRYVLDWEQCLLDGAVSDIFGYHALQLGMSQVDALRENRMPLRCVALDGSAAGPHWRDSALPARRDTVLVTRFDELPFASQSIDLIVLPHVLEFAQEPHRVLREVDRVLMPEGHIVLTGFNPASLWGVQHGMQRLGVRPFLPRATQMIALPRLKDWLKLLPALGTHRSLDRTLVLSGEGGRPLVAGAGQRVCAHGGQARARHAACGPDPQAPRGAPRCTRAGRAHRAPQRGRRCDAARQASMRLSAPVYA
jgi:SAM-dependent methyltransferase